MNEVENYLKKDIEGYYKKCDGYFLRGVAGVNRCKDKTRNDKAKKQAKLSPVPFCKVYSYVNEFLELVREENGFTEKNIKIDTIKLDGKEHIIIDNGIVVRDNNWSSSHWNGKTYDKYDKKYDVIKEKFDLERVSDILWFKFTDKGHLAVVAKSCDINWNEKLPCGVLVNEIEEKLDDSFVLIFPLTQEMIRTKEEPNSFYRKYSSEKLECAVGNYLISKGVPVIDYFSHMGYKYDI